MECPRRLGTGDAVEKALHCRGETERVNTGECEDDARGARAGPGTGEGLFSTLRSEKAPRTGGI